MAAPTERIILGIDPGTNVMGYGLLKIIDRKPQPIALGVLQMKKTDSHYLRLRQIHEAVLALIDEHHPDDLAIESPFMGINVASLVKLCRAQGVAMAAAAERDVPIFEYPPSRVKIAITGNGNAAKEQVAVMVKRVLALSDADLHHKLDATDALAIALCHHYEMLKVIPGTTRIGGPGTTQRSGKSSSWADFVARNQDKVHK